MTVIESLVLQPRPVWKNWTLCSGGARAGHRPLLMFPKVWASATELTRKLPKWNGEITQSIKGVFKLKLQNAYGFHYKNIFP